MNNGSGLRVVLWLSGCSHHCYNCQNPQTWNPDSGIPFDEPAKQEIFNELSKDYISGITFSGGDPLHENNLDEVIKLVKEIRISFPDKNIWLYTGFEWNSLMAKICQPTFPDEKFEHDRNIHMKDTLADSIHNNKHDFIGVGCKHLYGKKGIIQLLKDDGYLVECMK